MSHSVVVDPQTGKKTHVLIPIEEYERMIEELEDLEDINAIRKIKDEDTIPLEKVIEEFQKKAKGE